MREEFRDIKGFNGIYKISNLGRILSVGREIKNGRQLCDKLIAYNINNKGYIYSDLWHPDEKRLYKKLIHRCMAEAFLVQDDPKKTQVNHKNGVRTHNWISLDDLYGEGSNLSWDYPDTNLADRHARQKEFKEVLKAQRGMKIIENKREESEWNKKYSFMELFGL